MADAKLVIELTAQDKATGKIRGFAQAVEKTLNPLKRLQERLFSLKNLVISGLGFYGLAQAFSHATALAQQEEAAMRGLHQVLISMGRFTPELEKRLIGLADALELQTGFGNDAIITAEKFLSTYSRISNKVLPDTVKVTLDLARGWGIDLRTAANIVGKASMGLTGELTRYGITLSEEAKKTKDFALILRDIKEQVEGQARAWRWSAGGIKETFRSLREDAQKQFGYLLNDILAPFYETGTTYLTKLVSDLKNWRSNSNLVAEAQKKLALYSALALDQIVRLKDTIMSFLGKVREIDRESLGMGLIGWAFFGKKVGVFLALVGTAKRKLEDLLHIPHKSLTQSFKEAAQAWHDVIDSIMGRPTQNTWARVEETAKGIATSVRGIPEALKDASPAAVSFFQTVKDKIAEVEAHKKNWVETARGWAASIVGDIRAEEAPVAGTLAAAPSWGPPATSFASVVSLTGKPQRSWFQDLAQGKTFRDKFGFTDKSFFFDTMHATLQSWGVMSNSIQEQLNAMKNKTAETFNYMKTMAQSTAQAMERGFSDFFFNVMTGNFRNLGDVLKNFVTSIQRTIADLFAQAFVTKFLKGPIFSLFGLAEGGLLPGPFIPVAKFSEGGQLPGPFIPFAKFAGGGVVNRPTLGLVGEAGYPELVIPMKDGYVPVKQVGGGKEGSSQPVVQHVVNLNIHAMDAQSFDDWLARGGWDVIEARLYRSYASGGPMYNMTR